MRKPERIGNILPKVFKQLGIKEEIIEQYKALLVWDKVVGKTLALHTKPKYVINGVLWVKVKDPAWRPDLEFLKNDIVERINQEIKVGIKGVRFI